MIHVLYSRKLFLSNSAEFERNFAFFSFFAMIMMLLYMKILWTTIKKQYETFEKDRSFVIHASQEIRRASKLLIHAIVHKKKIIPDEEIKSIQKKIMALHKTVSNNPHLYHVGGLGEGIAEFVELVCLEAYKKGEKSLLSYIPHGLYHEAILSGIADATGELVRLARHSMDADEVKKAHEWTSVVYAHFIELPFSRNNVVRSKMEEVQRNMIRLEEILFALQLKKEGATGSHVSTGG